MDESNHAGDGYKTFRLPSDFVDEMDNLIGERKDLGFKSRAELAKSAIRKYMDEIRSEDEIDERQRDKESEDIG